MFGIMTIGEIDSTIVFTLFSILIIFPIQLLLCFKVKRVWLRLIPTISILLATMACFLLFLTATGLEMLGWLILTFYCASNIVVCGVGWIVWFIVKRVKDRKQL